MVYKGSLSRVSIARVSSWTKWSIDLPFWRPRPLLYRAEGSLYMCGAGSLHTDFWGRLPDQDPPGPATVFFLPTVFFSQVQSLAARHGSAVVEDVRSQAARVRSCRLPSRQARVVDERHAWHCASWRPT